MRHGEVWDAAAGEHTARVLLVSTDDYNSGHRPQCMVIIRSRPEGSAGQWAVSTTDTDSVVAGTVLVDTLCPVDPRMLRGQPVGTISGATLDRVKSALRLVFEL